MVLTSAAPERRYISNVAQQQPGLARILHNLAESRDVPCRVRSGKAPSRSVWSTFRRAVQCRPRSSAEVQAASRQDESPVHYERVCENGRGSASLGTSSSRATSTEKVSSSCSPRTTSRQRGTLSKTKTIDILDFVDPEEIDRALFRNALLPASRKRGGSLVCAAARGDSRIGESRHCQIILRETQHLAAVEVIGDALVLTMMRFADELVDLDASCSVAPTASGRRSCRWPVSSWKT